MDVAYVQIVGTSKLFSNKVSIEIDFGQENKLFGSDKDTRVKDVNAFSVKLALLSERGFG